MPTDMKITFRQSGGFAGLSRQSQVDAASLSPDESAALSSLIRQSGIHGTIAQKSPLARDAGQYEIIIERGDQVDQIVIDEPSVTPALRPLIQYLQKSAKPIPR